MKTFIHKLIDGLLIQPLATAITNRLQEGQTRIMKDLSDIQQAVDELKQGVLDEHTRIDGELGTLTKQLEAKATEHDDPELTTLAANIRGVTAGLAAFHPAEAPAGDPPATGSTNT